MNINCAKKKESAEPPRKGIASSGLTSEMSTPPRNDEVGARNDEGEEAQDQTIAQKILSFNLEGYRDNGSKKWELNGAVANILPNVIKLDYITAKAYGDEGSATLKAKRGLYNKGTKDVHLEENVVAKSSEGTRLVTDRLDWNQDTECIVTDAFVRIDRENLSSTGRGAMGNPQLKQIELKKDVVVELKEDPPTLITCDGPLVVNYEKNISVLNNNVRVSDQRGEIFADAMKVLFDPKARKLTRVVAIGDVRIQREGNTTHSERAVYTVKDGRVRLVGRPKLIVIPAKAGIQKLVPVKTGMDCRFPRFRGDGNDKGM